MQLCDVYDLTTEANNAIEPALEPTLLEVMTAPTTGAAPAAFDWQILAEDLCSECHTWWPYEPMPLVLDWCKFAKKRTFDITTDAVPNFSPKHQLR